MNSRGCDRGSNSAPRMQSCLDVIGPSFRRRNGQLYAKDEGGEFTVRVFVCGFILAACVKYVDTPRPYNWIDSTLQLYFIAFLVVVDASIAVSLSSKSHFWHYVPMSIAASLLDLTQIYVAFGKCRVDSVVVHTGALLLRFLSCFCLLNDGFILWEAAADVESDNKG